MAKRSRVQRRQPRTNVTADSCLRSFDGGTSWEGFTPNLPKNDKLSIEHDVDGRLIVVKRS